MAQSGTTFNSTSIQAASEMFKIQIIVISHDHKMAFFDQEYGDFKAKEGLTLYLLKSPAKNYEILLPPSYSEMIESLSMKKYRVEELRIDPEKDVYPEYYLVPYRPPVTKTKLKKNSIQKLKRVPQSMEDIIRSQKAKPEPKLKKKS